MKKLIMLCILLSGMVYASNTITNYKSGISIGFEGTQDTDYAFERFYHDTLIDDHGVFYIKAATKITLGHNELNTAYTQSSSSPPNEIIGADGPDGTPGSGDEGIIRYLVDGDLNFGYHWSDAFAEWDNPLPAYSAPVALADLTYDGSTPVVGTTGDNGDSVTDKDTYYHYGMTDAFGDEWHTLTVGDDDKWHGSGTKSRYGSDGKVFCLVVNPKTPLVSFEVTGDGQFYTTPAKTYNVPKIHDQITYVTDGVTMEFANIMTADPIYYRFGTNAFAEYTGPVSLDVLTDGEHTLEYYYDDGYHKTRTIVMNPPFPSAGETHGYMLWKTDAEYDAVVERITSADPDRAAIASTYSSRKTRNDQYSGNHQANWDSYGMKGQRYRSPAGLINAFVAKVEGADAARTAGGKTYAQYAKEMILDSWNNLDPVAHGYNQNFDARPSAEMGHFGYYQVNGMLSHVPAYDLLIGMGYTSDKVDGGITPIEDHKIRDGFAKFILLNLRELGGYGSGTNTTDPSPDPGVGMWDQARQVGGLLAAVCMPTYNTPYYGTSGFDGTAAAYKNVPFPDQALTWKSVFVDHDYTTQAYPNCRRYFNQVEGGLVTAEGMFFDRPGYYSQHLMGHCFQVQAMVMKIMHDHDYPCLVKSFENANVGRLIGLKGTHENLDSTTAGGYGLYAQISLVNEHFPTVAETAYLNITEGKLPWNSDTATVGDLLYGAGIYGMIWFHDDWEDYVSPVEDGLVLNPTGHGAVSAVPNPMTDHINISLVETHGRASLRFDIFDPAGNLVYTLSRTGHDLSLQWDGMCIAGVPAAPGMYYYRIDTGAESYTGKIFKIKH